MEEIRDCLGRIACKGDALTGLIEGEYKGYKTSVELSIGKTFRIERQKVVTEVTRKDLSGFDINSYRDK